MILNSFVFLVLSCLLCIFPFQKGIAATTTVMHPIYAGFEGGYGSTTWNGLVPPKDKQNQAVNVSMPIKAEEGGGVFGFFVGYEFIPYFALEASYRRYPSTKISFDKHDSMFSFENNGQDVFFTHTDAVSLMGKVMAPIYNFPIKIYSGAGVARIHRNDQLLNSYRYSPTFSLGLNYDYTPHIMGEIVGNYTAGFGEAQINPTEVYFPFLYSICLRLGYRF